MAGTPAWRLSGGTSNSDPFTSIGGDISSVSAGVSLFDNVSADESTAGDTEYRGIYVINAGDQTLLDVSVWVKYLTQSPDDEVAISLASEGIDGTMETLSDESTAPAGVSFTAPSSRDTGLAIGDLTPGQYCGVWVRRVVDSDANAYNNDSFTLRVEGDTVA